MRRAWVEDGAVRDAVDGDPFALFHPAVAALYATEVPDGTLAGARMVNGVWTNPPPPEPPPEPEPVEPEPVKRMVPVSKFLLRIPFAKLVAIRTAAAQGDGLSLTLLMVIETLKDVDLNDPDMAGLLGALVQAGALTADEAEAVLA